MSNGHSGFSRTLSLAFQLTTGDDVVTLAVRGELDLASTQEFEAKIAETLQTHAPRTLELELSGLNFMDSTGLRALWSMRQLAQDASCRFVIRSPSEAVSRLLHLTGMRRVFLIEDES